MAIILFISKCGLRFFTALRQNLIWIFPNSINFRRKTNNVAAQNEKLKNVALNDIHVELGAKMVEFAGYYMPIVYSSILEEHKCVRTGVGVFDVSHMGEFRVTGEKALDLIQKVTINDASKLAVNQVQYSAMCYADGGIVDDLLVYRFEDHYMLVVNASNIEKDFNWIKENLIDGAEIEDRSDDFTLLAIQGPKSLELVQELTETNLSELKYYWTTEGKVAGSPMIISRTGYTGEIGLELYMSIEYSEIVMRALLEKGKSYDLHPIGLGARDTLRLEKKMCLYGNDISKETNPYEAGLGWITKLDKGDFVGKDKLAEVKKEGVSRKLIAFELLEKGVPRHGYEIVKDSEIIGKVTSGSFSPMLEKGIGLGFVAVGYTAVDTEIAVRARGKDIPAIIIKPPFV